MRRIRRLRLERGWSGLELSHRARVHPSLVSELELGRRVPAPGSKPLLRIAHILGWQGPPEDLLEELREQEWRAVP